MCTLRTHPEISALDLNQPRIKGVYKSILLCSEVYKNILFVAFDNVSYKQTWLAAWEISINTIV